MYRSYNVRSCRHRIKVVILLLMAAEHMILRTSGKTNLSEVIIPYNSL